MTNFEKKIVLFVLGIMALSSVIMAASLWYMAAHCCIPCSVKTVAQTTTVAPILSQPTPSVTPAPAPAPIVAKRKEASPKPVAKQRKVKHQPEILPTARKPKPAKREVQRTSAPKPVPAPVQAPAPQQKVEVSVNQPLNVVQPEVPAPTPAPQITIAQPPKIEVPSPGPLLPGSAWDSILTTPLERGNIINASHLEQAFVIWKDGRFQLQPYIALNSTVATKPYSWDNRVEGEIGMRLVMAVKLGVIDFRVAEADEIRKGGVNKSGLLEETTGWLGWKQPMNPDAKGGFLSSAPGSTWWVLGNVSPFERNNLVGLAHIEQGVTLARFGKISLIPEATLTAGFDTKGEFWNNRVTYGGDFKIVVPFKSASFDVRGGYECAMQYRGGPSISACGPVVKVNFWVPWRLKGGEH